MRGNPLLKVLVPAVLLLVILIVVNPFGKKSGSQQKAPEAVSDLSDEELAALGLGDTPRDTLATMVAQLKTVRGEIDKVRQQNEQLQSENNRLRERESSVESRINQAVRNASDEARKDTEAARKEAARAGHQAKSLLDQLERKFDALSSSKQDELPVGLGLEQDDGSRFAGETIVGTIWVETSDALNVKGKGSKTGFAFPNVFDKVDETLAPLDRSQKELRAAYKGEQSLEGGKGRKTPKRTDNVKPVYTIAENSTLMGSIAMTALIGRVPIDGTVNDPYPFKVLIGRDNLAANGFDLPEVTGAVMSGRATGDWTLSCVRGQIESITFIFEDGTIRTLPMPEATIKRNSGNTTSNNMQTIRGGIGYLSNPHGVPCVPGERRSNGAEYLTTQSLITAAGAGVASVLSKDDGSNYSGSGTVVSDRNGALNSILTGGVADIRAWVNKLYGQAFAAIYVPPHAEVAVHIDHELTIDYEPHGRKVRFNESENTVSYLD